MSIEFLSALFLLLTFVMAGIVIHLFTRYLDGRARSLSIVAFTGWMLYVTVTGHSGLAASKKPPGLVFLLLPVLIFLVAFVVRHPDVKKFACRIPVPLLVGVQCFRVLVEIGLLGLYQRGLIPRLMTFEGGNLDIFIGLSAPVTAWLYASGRMNDRAVRAWSWVGIVALSNIVVRAFLTSAGIVKTPIPNVALGVFPFTYLPGFLAPLAMYLHVLVLRSLPRERGI